MRIRELRERRGLTGTELARMTGVTLPAVIGWENGSKTPTTDKLPPCWSARAATCTTPRSCVRQAKPPCGV